MLVTGVEAVGTTLAKVDVSTIDNVEDAWVMDVGKGRTEGLPEVSKEVTTEPVVLLVFDEVADCTAEVDRDVSEALGTVVTVTLRDVVDVTLAVVSLELGAIVVVVPDVNAMGSEVCDEDETAAAEEL